MEIIKVGAEGTHNLNCKFAIVVINWLLGRLSIIFNSGHWPSGDLNCWPIKSPGTMY